MRNLPIILSSVLIFLLFQNSFSQKQTNIPSEKGFADIGNCQISYEIAGNGTPLIMIHGGSLDKSMWDNQFYEFSKYYKVVRYDARKHGETQSDITSFSHHEDLSKLMEKLNIDKAVVLGLSMGGYIAIDFALAYPKKILSLIAVAPGLTGYEFNDKYSKEYFEKVNKAQTYAEIVELSLKAWTDGPYRTSNQVDSVVRKKVENMLTGFFANIKRGITEKRLSPEASNRLSEIKVPTLVIVGDLDMPDIIEISNLMEKQIISSHKVVIKGVAHMVNLEKPNEFNQIVEKFLQKNNFNY